MNAKRSDKKPAVYWASFAVMVFGIVSTTMFTMRQFKEYSLGHTFYEFIVGGVIFAVVGFAGMAATIRSR